VYIYRERATKIQRFIHNDEDLENIHHRFATNECVDVNFYWGCKIAFQKN
jgi:hypothetical protein